MITSTASSSIDLHAYCERVGYGGPWTPTIETLHALHRLHPAAIPFEAIDVLLGRAIDIAPAAIDAKLIGARRGGYCYEHNGLFKRALSAMGFDVQGLIARVQWLSPPDAPASPRTHMALRVTIDGTPWLADVGFGSCVPTSPLRLDHAQAQATAHESFRLVPSEQGHALQALITDRWMPVYELCGAALRDIDYAPINWFTSTHPASLFKRELIVTRTTPQARYVLLGNRLTIRAAQGSIDRRTLDAGELQQALVQTFGLPFDDSWWPLIELAALETA